MLKMELRDNVTTAQSKMNTNKAVVAYVEGRLLILQNYSRKMHNKWQKKPQLGKLKKGKREEEKQKEKEDKMRKEDE